MRTVVIAALAAAALVAVAGCAAPSSGRVYSREEARTAWNVVPGRVVAVDAVSIEGTNSWIGTAGGGYIGYELGRELVHGSASHVAGAVGSLVGAVAGAAVEERVTRQRALQIEVELDRGETISIVQADDVAFAPGERVKVLRRHDGAARVSKT